MKRAPFLVAALLTACTPGGMIQSGGSAAGAAEVTKIDVNLTLHATAVQLPQGSAGGYAPPQTIVGVGSFVQFTNSDGFAHTATALPGANAFPASSPFGISAQQQAGSTVSGPWSTGTLQPGQSSQPIRIDAAGTYLYGCFFHYGAPMRGAIVAQ